jgi:hypothetical protein
MSRSKKAPYYTDQQTSTSGRSKQAKREANRRVRKTEEVADGKAYRKVSNPWDIRDWSFHCPDDPKAYRK